MYSILQSLLILHSLEEEEEEEEGNDDEGVAIFCYLDNCKISLICEKTLNKKEDKEELGLWWHR